MELRKLNNGYYSLYDSDGDIVASNNPNTPCSRRLSKENCDEIFGVVDVEKLAQDYMEQFKNPMLKNYRIGEAFNDGFKKAMELNKDKLFTVEDIMKAFEAGYETLESEKTYNEHYDILIQSLQQPKEIEVEIVTHVDLAATPVDSRHPDAYLGTDTGIPFLDENGCLILKKK